MAVRAGVFAERAEKGQVMNPRYLAYCSAHGRTPDDMLAYDREQFPGGCMVGFMLWINQRMTAFLAVNRDVDRYVMSDSDHARFTAFLRS